LSALCEEFGNAYAEKEIPNKAMIHRLVIKFWDVAVFVCDECPSKYKTGEFMFVPISSSASFATTR
jgi:hypothetical protein